MRSPLDVARFTTAQVAAAIGITANSLMAKLQRGTVVLSEEEAADLRNPGTGRSRLFSARRVLHIALSEALARMGLPLLQASKIALNFTDTNGADDDMGALEGDAAAPTRMPSELFADDQTIFRVLFNPVGVVAGVQVNRGATLGAGPLQYEGTACAGAILVDLTRLQPRVLAALGIRL